MRLQGNQYLCTLRIAGKTQGTVKLSSQGKGDGQGMQYAWGVEDNIKMDL
jgi:hypothetical protein